MLGLGDAVVSEVSVPQERRLELEPTYNKMTGTYIYTYNPKIDRER